jgi:hypothetical protein
MFLLPNIMQTRFVSEPVAIFSPPAAFSRHFSLARATRDPRRYVAAQEEP